jgi:DNA-3-methyladenine glycosylase II
LTQEKLTEAAANEARRQTREAQAGAREAQAQALAALRAADPVLGRLIDGHPALDPWEWRARWPQEPFALLVRTITGQQISTSAANAIFARVRDLLGADLTPAGVTRRSDEELRAAGLSRAKLASLRDLSARILDGSLDLGLLADLPDDELRRGLMAVRGIGPWTVELLLIGLAREDALPAADIGLRRAVRDAYGLDHLPSGAEVAALGERWRPYRSLAAAYLYASLRQPTALD